MWGGWLSKKPFQKELAMHRLTFYPGQCRVLLLVVYIVLIICFTDLCCKFFIFSIMSFFKYQSFTLLRVAQASLNSCSPLWKPLLLSFAAMEYKIHSLWCTYVHLFEVLTRLAPLRDLNLPFIAYD